MSTTNGTLMHVPRQTTLSRFDAARCALEQARTVDEIKDVRDKAEALRQYCKQAGESLAMQNDIAEIKLRAERKAGELLKEMGPQHGGDRKSKSKSHDGTLKKLGINKNQSARWQQEAAVSEKEFERHVAEVKTKGKELTSTGLLELARELAHREHVRKRNRDAKVYAAANKDPKDHNVLTGDMGLLWDRLKDNSVDLFLTDPPWMGKEIGCYKRLAELAAAKLKPGGLCLAYSGKCYLTTVMATMQEHLSYWWMFAIELTGNGNLFIDSRNVRDEWRTLLVFGKPPLCKFKNCTSDLLQGGGREKGLHEWQQAQPEADYVIDRLTEPGDLVVDPFCGSGTVLAAAKAAGRKWLGVEIDPERAAVARKRLSEGQKIAAVA